MKVGLIGCGGMGTTHNLSLKALSSKMDVEVTALADCRPEFLEKAAEQWPDARLYKTGMELLEAETLDSVHICLPVISTQNMRWQPWTEGSMCSWRSRYV